MTTLRSTQWKKDVPFLALESIKKFLIHPMGVTHKPSSLAPESKVADLMTPVYTDWRTYKQDSCLPPQREVSSTYFLENLRGKLSLFIKSLILKVFGWQKKKKSLFWFIHNMSQET